MIAWNNTKEALSQLESLLHCKICGQIVSDPCSLESCDHHFCRGCVEKVVDADSKCPVCGSFAWVRDMKSNRQLAHTAALCLQLGSLIRNDDDNPQPFKSCSSNLENWEETQGYAEEEVNTFIFPSQEHESRGDGQKVDDEYVEAYQPSQTISNIKEHNTADQKSVSNLYCIETHTSPVFKKAQPLKTYSRVAMKNSGMLRRLTSTAKRKPKSFTSAKGRSSSVTYKASEEDDLESDKRRRVFKEVDENVDAREMETNSSPDPPNKSVSVSEDSFKEVVVTKGKEATFKSEDKFSGSFTKVMSRNFKATNISKKGAPAEDILHGTPRTRAQKRRSPGTSLQNAFETSRGNAHIEDTSKEETKKSRNQETKKSRRHHGTLENFFTSPDIHSEIIAATRKTSRKEGHGPRHLSQSPVGRRNKRGETPLHVAAIKGKLEIVTDLLKQGADPNAKDNAGWTPLHEACNHGHVAIAELLLDSGAMLDMTGGSDHDTPLHDAVANGRLEIVKLLLARGAPLKIRNKQGLLPKDYAVGEAMLDAFSQSPESYKQKGSPITVQPLSGNDTTTKYKVFLATGLSAVQKEQLQKCVDRLGGSCIVSEYSESVTHAVTATDRNGTCKRTIKYLHCVLTGKWIVRFEWISKCLRSKQWVEETPFEVAGTNEAKVEAPRRARQNALKQLPGLFDGCSFFFCGEFEPPHLSKDELVQMVKSGGGKILAREPRAYLDESLCLPSRDAGVTTVLTTVVYHAQPDSEQYRRTHYVIFDPLSERRSRMCKYSYVCFAPVTWLMDCISRFEVVDVPCC